MRAALLQDQEKLMVTPDPYGGGKEMGALGRLALIADEVRACVSIRRPLDHATFPVSLFACSLR